MKVSTSDDTAIVAVLNRILEAELAGVVRYTHYSFMIFGYGRIPIVHWLRGQATESLRHAEEAGEMITLLGGRPSLGVGELLSGQRDDIGEILRESLEHERKALGCYRELLALAEGRDIMVEEYARRLIAEESVHIGEVNKMLRQPGQGAA